MPSPHVGEGKREKKIYKARKDRRKGASEIGGEKNEKRKIISLGRVRRG